MTRIIHLVALVAVNAVPVLGWFVADWSAATTLVVYWFENVAACLFVAAEVFIHQRWSPRRGHFDYRPPADSTSPRSSSRASRSGSKRFVTGFLMTSLVFCAAHGLFLGVILFLLGHDDGGAHLDWRGVGTGCLYVLAFLVLDFLVDLMSLRTWTFHRIEQTANLGLGRIVVVHLTLIFGMFAVAVTGANSALFGVFVVLKTLFSLAQVLPKWEPAAPPRWLSRAMNRLPNVHPAETFEDQWAEDQADEATRRDRNEEPWAPARRPRR